MVRYSLRMRVNGVRFSVEPLFAHYPFVKESMAIFKEEVISSPDGARLVMSID